MTNQEVEILVRKYEPEILEFARDIIKTRSYSTEEKGMVMLIKSKMEALDFDEVKVDGIGNIVGRVGNGPRKILYDAHIDTVWAEDKENWKVDPFAAVVDGDLLYGRGSSDEKAAMSSMLYGAAIAKQLGLLDGFSLYISGTVLEETCDGLSVIHMVEKEGFRPDFVVICEPTSLDVYRGHRGRVELKITTTGTSAHAAHPDKGDNAIYKMAQTVLNIEKLTATFKDDPFLGKGTAVVSIIESKAPSINSVPYESTIYIDRRITVGETKETVLAEFRGAVNDPGHTTVELTEFEDTSWTGLHVCQEKYFPTWVLDENHPLVKAGVDAATEARGKTPRISRWIFSTNGVAFMGHFNIPSIGFGPGDEWLAHAANEYVRISDLYEAARFYALLPSKLAEEV
ncbi:YgeY family selenium metabolism-linked hydrolase [Candidatus Cryosericum hinesii]|jgi:putative selenium metabolism hydrolase|uniref:YgeY family selenium metabolism-linked hydrolase n=1 Tax=Candidatus Cryosericum hinesii TaxID=2290915 RepID=A0A398DS09_9BACT|nr:YgeY family selenium metabolism-linked hydrolase [Candidatus Cryosericum hinesii]RIE14044.1 YgeY family selenium metabolism-linked hydrolase [Candidatus Cryosericum hinesii]RIE15061.1 YgeY family selenium metabolism-linked hydrolase [Candidatus Cryosericum hinesii]